MWIRFVWVSFAWPPGFKTAFDSLKRIIWNLLLWRECSLSLPCRLSTRWHSLDCLCAIADIINIQTLFLSMHTVNFHSSTKTSFPFCSTVLRLTKVCLLLSTPFPFEESKRNATQWHMLCHAFENYFLAFVLRLNYSCLFAVKVVISHKGDKKKSRFSK